MAKKNYYQILNVHPDAEQAIIQAAYQRLVRIYSGEDGLPYTGNESKLQAVEEAYTVLRNPARRFNYDAELQIQSARSPRRTRHIQTQDQAEGVSAWLAYQRREDGYILFQIGWAADFSAIAKALNIRIPAPDRQYDEHKQEWRISEAYGPILKELFNNFESPDDPVSLDLPVPIFQRRTPLPTTVSRYHTWMGWTVFVLLMLAMAIGGNELLALSQRRRAAVQMATTTAMAADESPQLLVNQFPTATPMPTEPVVLVAQPLYQSVHLRSGPGTEFESLGFIYQGQEYSLIGRTADSGWLAVMTVDALGWSATWTLEIEGDLTQLAVYAAGTPLPISLLTPAASATPFATSTENSTAQ